MKKTINNQAEIVDRKIVELLHSLCASDIETALEKIVTEACKLVGGTGGSIWLRSISDPDRIVLTWSHRPNSGKNGNVIGEAYYTNQLREDGTHEGLTGWIFGTGQPLFVRDIEDENEIRKHRRLKWDDKYKGFETTIKSKQHRRKSFLAVPIKSHEVSNYVLGVLRVAEAKLGAEFSETSLKVLEVFGSYLSGLLSIHRMRTAEGELIDNLMRLTDSDEMQLVLDGVVKTLPILIEGTFCSIFLKTAPPQFRLEATNSPRLSDKTNRKAGDQCIRYLAGVGKTGQAIATGESLILNRDLGSELFSADSIECDDPSSFLCVPIREENEVVGAIRLLRQGKTGSFVERDKAIVEKHAEKLAAAIRASGFLSRGLCFAIMPFTDKLRPVYEECIKPIAHELGFLCKREDEFLFPEPFMQSVVKHLSEAKVVIAEISDGNPNVYYELGIAHMMGKPVILLSTKAPPANIQHVKYIPYEDTIMGQKKLMKLVRDTIKDICKIE